MEQERYNRQIILNGFGETAQLKLLKAKVLVIGIGGLGCPALQYLVAAGVGCVGLADDDVVSLSNLHRQILFATEDVGRLKTEVASQRLKSINPELELQVHPVEINRKNALELLKNYDLILDGTDNFESRYTINDACVLLDKPLIFAAVSGYEGQLAVFNVADTQGQRTNYRDLFPVPPLPGEVPTCSENGVLGVLPGIMGCMAAAEAIKLITGIGKPLINKLLHYSLLNHQQYKINIHPGKDYTIPANALAYINHQDQNMRVNDLTFTEITAAELTELQQQASTLVIDVRESHEFPKLDPGRYTQIPMSVFEGYIQTHNLEAENIVLLCQHGIRSVAAAELLSEKYGNEKKIYSLKGGIVKWPNHFLTKAHERKEN